jgi:phospholipase/carboxylesterase
MRFLFILFLFLINAAQAQSRAPLQTDLPLPYLVQADGAARDRPLIIFLHGYGSNEADLFGMKGQFSDRYTYLSVRAPLVVGPQSYQWFRNIGSGSDYNGDPADVKNSEALLLDFIVKATEKFHTRADRVVLIGFSQGAIMSYQLGLDHPEAVRGIAALSGRILPPLAASVSGTNKPANKLKNLSVFIGHGMSDQRLPYDGAVAADALLKKTGLQPDFLSYFGMGHAVSARETNDVDAWLENTLGKQEK